MSLQKPPVVTQKPFTWQFESGSINESPPTENAWYNLISTTSNVMLIEAKLKQNNNEGAAKSLRAKLTIDGTTIQSSLTSCNANTMYYLTIAANGYLSIGTGASNFARYTPLWGKSVLLEIQFGDSPETNQTLQAWVIYQTLQETTV